MASATENVIQLDNSKCRICLFTKHNLCPLFRRGLSMKVMKLADIKMYEGDGLPSSICLDCELEVKRSTNFIAQIQRADAKWREILAKEKEFCGIDEKHKELSVRLPEKEDMYQVASTSQSNILYDQSNILHDQDNMLFEQGNMLHDNNYHAEVENESPMIEIEEFNVKQEIPSFDQFLSEKEEVHSEGDHDHYGDVEHGNDQPEDENELNPLDHVDIVEDRSKGHGMELSNDPLGQEEPLIETQRNENEPSVDPLTCMKQEVVAMDIDKDTQVPISVQQPAVSGPSSSVRRPNTTISFLICTVPAKSKSSEIKPVLYNIQTSNSSCQNISAGKPIGIEDRSQPQEPIHNTVLISPRVPNQSQGKGSLWTSEINQHAELKTHFQNPYDFKCLKCNERFITKKNLFLHCREKHSSDLLKCNMCDTTYKRYRDLRKHKLEVHQGESISLECVVCRKTFGNLNSLNFHQKFYHIAYENIECELCDSKCLGPHRMKMHLNQIHDGTGPARCRTCGKIYKNSLSLKQHQIFHDVSEKFCRICGQSFQGQISLNHHMKHEHSKKDVFPCKLCNETFSDQSLLTSHKNKLHRKRAIPEPAFCEICGKLFKSSGILKKHKLVHSNERCFICDICGASFKQRVALSTHQRVHSTMGKYCCDRCNKSFRWQQTFAKHLKKCDMREKDRQKCERHQ